MVESSIEASLENFIHRAAERKGMVKQTVKVSLDSFPINARHQKPILINCNQVNIQVSIKHHSVCRQ